MARYPKSRCDTTTSASANYRQIFTERHVRRDDVEVPEVDGVARPARCHQPDDAVAAVTRPRLRDELAVQVDPGEQVVPDGDPGGVPRAADGRTPRTATGATAGDVDASARHRARLVTVGHVPLPVGHQRPR